MRHHWLLLLAAALAPAARADNIWERRDPRAAFLFQDNRARAVGDLLTVAINEATNANEKEQRALDKGSNANFGYNFSAKGSGKGGGSAANLDMSNNSRRQFNGSAQLTTDRTFLDRLSVTVVDVLPNGNLVVEGYRSRMVAGEQRVLHITGVVRPADINAQNTVESRYVANFRVSYLGKGPASTFVNQGWFSRVVNKLWPF